MPDTTTASNCGGCGGGERKLTMETDPLPLFVVRCLFCKREHRSFYWDELEAGIMACRDQAPEWQKGLLADFPDDGHTSTRSVEEQLYLDACARGEHYSVGGIAGDGP